MTIDNVGLKMLLFLKNGYLYLDINMTKREKKYIKEHKTRKSYERKLSKVWIPIEEYFAQKELVEKASARLNMIFLWGK